VQCHIFQPYLILFYDWNQFSAQIIWLLTLMFLTGKFRNLLDFMKREMSWKMWHCSLFLLLAYNVLTEKREKENKILGKKTKSFLLHCLLWVRFKRKNRRRKTRKKKTFFAFFSLSLIIDIFHTMPFVSSDCDYYNTPAFDSQFFFSICPKLADRFFRSSQKLNWDEI